MLPMRLSYWLLLHTTYAVEPLVVLPYGKYRGTAHPDGITQWLGIRYAAAPLGDLRFAHPEDPPQQGTVLADHHGPLCLATGDDLGSDNASEDCLYLDVYAPSHASPRNPLPVYFFIQGGGFNSNSNANYSGAGLITASNHSIIVVTFNYRVGPYGFLASQEIANSPTAILNAGLQDQLHALVWVQKHVSAFGGNPDHVVLGGDSAGAASITFLLTAYGGEDIGLFHAAAAESQSFAPLLTVEESQYQYDSLIRRAKCSPIHDTLACLRSKSTSELQSINTNIPYPGRNGPPLYMYGPVLDGDLIQDYAYRAFSTGAFVDIPVIFGDDTNGGTIFTPNTTSTLAESNEFLRDQFPYLTTQQLQRINTLYPNTGPSFPNTGAYWRQASTTYGDLRYMCPGLFISSAYSRSNTPSWNYRFNVQDPSQAASGLGVPHTVEIHAIWGPENTHGAAPQSYYPGQENAWIVPLIQGYWVSFIKSFDPNAYRIEGSPRWEEWTVGGRERLLFDKKDTTGMESVDEGLRERCEYLSSIGVSLRQ